jgi:aminodeoxyfutalosine synthase
MDFFIQRSGLRDIYDKVAAGERISEADALRLFESKDLNAVGAIADFARQKKTGNNRASYIINRYINYSNYCILSCQFCSFARKKRDADGFQFSVEEIVQKAREALKPSASRNCTSSAGCTRRCRSAITPTCSRRCER